MMILGDAVHGSHVEDYHTAPRWRLTGRCHGYIIGEKSNGAGIIPQKGGKTMNVIWVISDQLRRDHLGCYGNQVIHTPSLDALAGRSVRFDRHYIASFPTMPARADYLTGRWTGCFFPGWAPLPQGMVTLPQILNQKGLNTTAVVDTPFYLRNNLNYDRGFSTFFDIPGRFAQLGREALDISAAFRFESDRLAPQTFTKAMQWLERHYKEDFFLWVDTWEPHGPSYTPDFYTELYKTNAVYRGSVTMLDTWLGHFLRCLENMDLMKKTAIIFVSDHGTYHGEHGRFDKDSRGYRPDGTLAFYNYSPLYEEVAAVPLLIYVPNIPPGAYSGLTSAIDLAPTVLDILGQEIPSSMEGQSLLPAMKASSVAGREYVVSGAPFGTNGRLFKWEGHEVIRITAHAPKHETKVMTGEMVYMSGDTSVTVTTDEWSLIYAVDPGLSELFHLSSDPKQEKNVINEHPEVAKELHQLLVKFLRETNVSDHLLKSRLELR